LLVVKVIPEIELCLWIWFEGVRLISCVAKSVRALIYSLQMSYFQ